jgi:voltage-gated potassium channel
MAAAPPTTTSLLFTRLRMPLLGAAGIFLYGTVGYTVLGFDLVGALYMTALALTTAGFNPAGELSDAARLFTVTIAVLGVSAFLVILAVITSAFADAQLGAASRRRKMDRRIADLRNHLIICAYGRVGRTVARDLEKEGASFVVLEPQEDLQDKLERDGVLHMVGDPTAETLLRKAGIEHASGIVCAMDSDSTNVYITLSARSLNPTIFIAARAREPESADRLYKAGADRVVSPYVSSGHHMALLALRRNVVDYMEVFETGGDRLRIDEVVVDEHSRFVGMTLRDAGGNAAPILLRRRGEMIRTPSLDLTIEPGDELVLLVDPDQAVAIEGPPST